MTPALQQPAPADREAALAAAKPWIEAGCAYSDGALTFEAIAERVMTGANQLWGLVELDPPRVVGAVVTAIDVTATGRDAWVICVGAENSEGRVMAQDTIEKWARAEGCKRLVTWGRKGWAKKLSDWRIHRIEFVKDI